MSERPQALCFQALTPDNPSLPYVSSVCHLHSNLSLRDSQLQRFCCCWNPGPERGRGLHEGTQPGMGRHEFPALPTVPGRNPFSAFFPLSPSPSEHSLSVILPPPDIFFSPSFSCPTHVLGLSSVSPTPGSLPGLPLSHLSFLD